MSAISCVSRSVFFHVEKEHLLFHELLHDVFCGGDAMAAVVQVTGKVLKHSGCGVNSAISSARGYAGPLLPDSLADIAIDVTSAAASSSSFRSRGRKQAMKMVSRNYHHSKMGKKWCSSFSKFRPFSINESMIALQASSATANRGLPTDQRSNHHRSVSTFGSNSLFYKRSILGITAPFPLQYFSTAVKELDEILIITASCVQRIKQLQAQEGKPDLHLRVAVDGGGCSGFQYTFEMEDTEPDADDDRVFEKDDCRVVVDGSSFELIKGSTVDFSQEMIRRAFTIKNNPQSETACGCGSSFAVKNFTSNPALD